MGREVRTKPQTTTLLAAHRLACQGTREHASTARVMTVNMERELSTPTANDCGRMAEIHVRAMETNPLLHAQFPTSESIRRLEVFLAEHYASIITPRSPARSRVLVARHLPSRQVAGFAAWDVPAEEMAEEEKLESGDIASLEGCQKQYLEDYAALSAGAAVELLKGEKCYRKFESGEDVIRPFFLSPPPCGFKCSRHLYPFLGSSPPACLPCARLSVVNHVPRGIISLTPVPQFSNPRPIPRPNLHTFRSCWRQKDKKEMLANLPMVADAVAPKPTKSRPELRLYRPRVPAHGRWGGAHAWRNGSGAGRRHASGLP